MKHPQKPPKAFAALVIGMLGFTIASAVIFVSAAPPMPVGPQKTQPVISKIGIKPLNAKGKGNFKSYSWIGQPIDVAYSDVINTMEVSAQVSSSGRAPTWYAFDSFSLISKNVTADKIQKIALAQAPDAKSSLWQKVRTSKFTNAALEPDEKRVLVVYVSNADPYAALGAGTVDSMAYFVVQGDSAPVSEQSAGELTFSSPETQVSSQVFLMGQVNKKIYEFKASASAAEDLVLNQAYFDVYITGKNGKSVLGMLSNFRIFDGDVQVGSAVAVVIPGKNVHNDLLFTGLNYTIPKGETRTLSLVVDVSAQPDIYSGQQFSVVMSPLMKLDGKMVATQAVGKTSGGSAKIISKLNDTSNTMYVYKTKIAIALAQNSPSGNINKGNKAVLKFVVSDAPDVNMQAGHVQKISIRAKSSFVQPAGTTRTLRLYRGENVMDSNLLGTYEFGPSTCLFNSSTKCAGATFELPTNSNGEVIESDTQQIYTVTFDVYDAFANDTLQFSANILGWSDGVTEDIIGPITELKIEGGKIYF